MLKSPYDLQLAKSKAGDAWRARYAGQYKDKKFLISAVGHILASAESDVPPPFGCLNVCIYTQKTDIAILPLGRKFLAISLTL